MRDSVSGRAAAAGATALVVSGQFREEASYPDNPASDYPYFALAHERPGLYAVQVTKPGYATWAGMALVRDEGCHVGTERLLVRLQPSAGT